MTSFTAEGPGSYSKACEVMDALKAKGLGCGVTVGGLWLDIEQEQIALAQQVCDEFNWRVRGGASTMMTIQIEMMSVNKGDNGWMQTAQKNADSQSVVDEWLV